jgi:hypothetical protein
MNKQAVTGLICPTDLKMTGHLPLQLNVYVPRLFLLMSSGLFSLKRTIGKMGSDPE